MPATNPSRSDKAEADKTEAGQPAAPALPAERTLRMVRRFRQYNRGEVAGFGRALADELIRQGVAVDVAGLSVAGPGIIRK